MKSCQQGALLNGHDRTCGGKKCRYDFKNRPELVERQAAAKRGKVQSMETRLKRSASMKGKNKGAKNGQYRGTVTNILCQAVRHSIKGREWRKKVLERDKVCVQCRSDYRLEADHIIALREIIETFCITTLEEALAFGVLFHIDNGRLLCRTCHKVTRTYGNRFT